MIYLEGKAFILNHAHRRKDWLICEKSQNYSKKIYKMKNKPKIYAS
jgi:hypothetical protein